jgi:hypothetical protein
MNIEPLEPRIAPATLTGHVLTYTDVDGDKVVIGFSKGMLTDAMFTFDTGSVDGDNSVRQQLQFGFSSVQIGSFNSLGFTAPLAPGTSDDLIQLSPIAGNVAINEV